MSELTANDKKKLSSILSALIEERRALQQAIDEQKGVNISSRSLETLFAELRSLASIYPNIVQPFDTSKYHSHGGRNEDYYNASGVRAYLGNAIGKLNAVLHTDDTAPVTEARSFLYVQNSGIRSILERDYGELQRAFVSKCSKSVIILCGGAIEAILLDRLQRAPVAACAATVAPKQSDLAKWSLAELISVAHELKIISPGVERLASPVREFRNLIHPGNELRHSLSFGEEEARIAIEVLHIVDRDMASSA